MARNAYDTIIATTRKLLSEQALDRLTVRLICERAGVNRQTFYYHFKSLKDVCWTMIKDDLGREAWLFEPDNQDFSEVIRGLLNYIRRNRVVIGSIYDSSYQADFRRSWYAYTEDRTGRVVDQVSRDMQLPVMRAERDFLVHCMTAVIMDDIVRFIEDGAEWDIEETAEYSRRVLNDFLAEGIRRLSAG